MWNEADIAFAWWGWGNPRKSAKVIVPGVDISARDFPDTKLEWYLRYQVLRAASMKIITFCDIAPRSLGVNRRFRGACCLHNQGDDRMMETVRTAETSVYYETTRRYILEGCNLESYWFSFGY
jgi:hypothetical protein